MTDNIKLPARWFAGWLVSNSEGDEDFINNEAALAGRHYKGGAPLRLEASFDTGNARVTLPDDIERMAVNRYRPVPSGVLAYKVVGGDGDRSLFSGTKDGCQIVARKLTEAFLDGAHAALDAQAQEAAPRDSLHDCAVGDSNYAAGMLLGWNLCTDGRDEDFRRIRGDRLRAAASASKEAKEAAPATPKPAQPLTDDQIKRIMLDNGFTIKEGLTDLKPYVYAAARELIAAATGVKND